MFSTAQLDLLAPLVQAMYVDGYQYYVVHTNTDLSTSYNNYNFRDLTCYFSKEPIVCSGYRFSSTGDCVEVNAISRNASNNSGDSKQARLVSQKISGFEVLVDSYEHILTNADGTYYGDIMAMTEYSNSHDLGYNIDVNDFFVPSVLLGVVVILLWFKVWFARNGGVERGED